MSKDFDSRERLEHIAARSGRERPPTPDNRDPGGLDPGGSGHYDPEPESVPDDVLALRRRATGRVASAYAVLHGQPSAHAGFDAEYATNTQRWGISARAAIAAGIAVVLIALGVVAWNGIRADRNAELLEPVGAASNAPAPSSGGATPGSATQSAVGSPAASARAEVVVHVAGQVRSPGLVRLTAGARVADAVTAAGGPTKTADLGAVNLARPLVDGEQIVVPAPGDPAPQPVATSTAGTSAGSGGGPSSLVNINTADASGLDTLPGIGPVLAERIVAWRTENGQFASVDDLTQVSGIGPGVMAKIKDHVCV